MINNGEVFKSFDQWEDLIFSISFYCLCTKGFDVDKFGRGFAVRVFIYSIIPLTITFDNGHVPYFVVGNGSMLST